MSDESVSKRTLLEKRARAFYLVRTFFDSRGYTEVDCPALSRYASIDAHIDLIEAKLLGECCSYLHSSPEYAMKRLLSEGSGPIYQLGHVFRDGEVGRNHNPEFTLLEWYRLEIPGADCFEEVIKETLELLKVFGFNFPVKRFTYPKLFEHYTDLDLLNLFQEDLEKQRETLKRWILLHIPSIQADQEDRDTLLQLILSHVIEPQFETESLTLLTSFPKSQAALSAIKNIDGLEWAMRFETYIGSVEVANGYYELTDPVEQLKRLKLEQKKREALGKSPLPIDPNFILALENGLPPSSGVAVGFDRLFMLYLGEASLSKALPFTWDQM